MDKEIYSKVVGNSLQKKIQKRNRYLKQFRILKSMNDVALNQLNFYLKERDFVRKQIVYKKGQPTDGLYFVKSGSFEVLSEPELEKREKNKKARGKPVINHQQIPLRIALIERHGIFGL
jgi:CRP-like cAMP-binding protein